MNRTVTLTLNEDERALLVDWLLAEAANLRGYAESGQVWLGGLPEVRMRARVLSEIANQLPPIETQVSTTPLTDEAEHSAFHLRSQLPRPSALCTRCTPTEGEPT